MQIGFILFPNVTQLDFTDPLQVLNRLPGATIHVLAKTLDPVETDCPIKIVPTGTFALAPKLDLICVPGGFGTVEACQDAETIAFVKKAGSEAKYITSVCTGAFVLGVAGLLKGKRATTHWAYTEYLSNVGAIYEPGRVVRDGNVITGGGVTAGIDFAFTLVSEIAGEQTAKALQLALEYDPAPPTDHGSPQKAKPDVLAQLKARYKGPADDLAKVLGQ